MEFNEFTRKNMKILLKTHRWIIVHPLHDERKQFQTFLPANLHSNTQINRNIE